MHPARIPAVRVLALAVAALVALLVALAPHASAATSVLTPSPSAWDYGSTDIHAGGPTQTFTFTNNTPGTVNVAGVAIVGADPSGFQLNSNGCLGAMLSMFGACDVQVTFAPTATGVQTAALEISDDSGTLDVPLSGTGITGTLSASPNPIQFTAEPYFYGGQQQSITIQVVCPGFCGVRLLENGPLSR
ncbi:MAG TPA: choice-of-anchor D domain-containing protein [bacterium]|nr:choice-of-anchor D domain-containing protein [bacterium]